MARVAVVIKDHTFDGDDGDTISVGERYRIVDEAKDVTDTYLLFAIAANDDEDRVIPIDLGDGYALMTKDPDENGISFSTYFRMEEN